MRAVIRFIKKVFNNPLFLKSRLFIAIGIVVAMFLLGFVYIGLFVIARIAFILLMAALGLDIYFLFSKRNALIGKRDCADRLSNGDENNIYLYCENRYGFNVRVSLLDEVPHQFQIRDFNFGISLAPRQHKTILYKLRPVRRGEYDFGALHAYVSSPVGLVARRFTFGENRMVPVYPSYLQMRKYELFAISNRLTEIGIKKIRKIGHNREFDQIKEYVSGDDLRTVNWKATARKGSLMVNTYQDEKSQQLYSVIDKGRAMKMPFEGMTLLDYAINSSLVISNIAIKKDDKAGLITFSNRIGSILKAEKKSTQMQSIMEALYNQDMRFQESDFGRLYRNIKAQLRQRSLVMLYTNFESLVSMNRQLQYLRKIAKDHLLVVIFFENTELAKISSGHSKTTEDIYIKTIAEKFAFEKRLIVKELRKYGIHTILTSPQNLTVASLNKYLELKSRGLI
jgi:uncharacterized protein (DUF58 family)